MKHSFKNITLTSNLPITILLSVGCLLLWLPDFMQAAANNAIAYQLFYLPLPIWVVLNPLWIVSAALLLTGLNAWLLMYLFYQLGINRGRSFVPIFLYLLTIGAVRSLHTNVNIHIAIFLFFVVLFMVYKMYKSRVEVESAFLITLLLVLGGCSVPDLLFLIPFLWLTFVISSAFSLRVWLSSVVCLLTSALTIGVYVILSGRNVEVGNAFATLFDRTLFHGFYTSWVFPTFLGTMALFFVLFLGAFYAYQRDNVRMQTSLNGSVPLFLACLTCVFPAAALPNLSGLALIIMLCFAVRYFLSVQSVFRSIIFFVYTAVLLLYWSVPLFHFPF